MRLVLGLPLQVQREGATAGTSVEVHRTETMEPLGSQHQLPPLLCALNWAEGLSTECEAGPSRLFNIFHVPAAGRGRISYVI